MKRHAKPYAGSRDKRHAATRSATRSAKGRAPNNRAGAASRITRGQRERREQREQHLPNEVPVRALRRQKGGQWLCAPLHPRLPLLFLTDVTALDGEVRADDVLLVRPGRQARQGLCLAVAALNLEREDDPAAQERIVKSAHAIGGAFPQAVLEEIRDFPDTPGEKDFAGRRDLRDLDFVTIDGTEARDFDDAVHVEAIGERFRLRVAIADVARYVPPGSALDAEAERRGNSCYFPLSVEPMLPEKLSNGLCSLRPHVPRLVMVVEMLFSEHAQRLFSTMLPAVIVSKARLTYDQVERALLLNEPEEPPASLVPMLRTARVLARRLRGRRIMRGALDFDIPEPEVFFDDSGAVSRIAPRKRHFGHRMIEEFMIAANEAVAAFLEQQAAPLLYRAHPSPDADKLTSLVAFLERSGLAPSPPPCDPVRKKKGKKGKRAKRPALSGTDLQAVLAHTADSPDGYIVTRLLLRAMMQAQYQSDNPGHFGLASSCYCHFTSPIRRYADLTVHRALKSALALPGADKMLSAKTLDVIAKHCNKAERNAADAEREMHKRLSILLLRDHIGESFDGRICAVTDFGVFVELPSCMAEGLLRLDTLDDDFYEYLPDRQELRGSRTRRAFRLGQRLRVVLTAASLGGLQVSLRLEEG